MTNQDVEVCLYGATTALPPTPACLLLPRGLQAAAAGRSAGGRYKQDSIATTSPPAGVIPAPPFCSRPVQLPTSSAAELSIKNSRQTTEHHHALQLQQTAAGLSPGREGEGVMAGSTTAATGLNNTCGDCSCSNTLTIAHESVSPPPPPPASSRVFFPRFSPLPPAAVTEKQRRNNRASCGNQSSSSGVDSSQQQEQKQEQKQAQEQEQEKQQEQQQQQTAAIDYSLVKPTNNYNNTSKTAAQQQLLQAAAAATPQRSSSVDSGISAGLPAGACCPPTTSSITKRTLPPPAAPAAAAAPAGVPEFLRELGLGGGAPEQVAAKRGRWDKSEELVVHGPGDGAGQFASSIAPTYLIRDQRGEGSFPKECLVRRAETGRPPLVVPLKKRLSIVSAITSGYPTATELQNTSLSRQRSGDGVCVDCSATYCATSQRHHQHHPCHHLHQRHQQHEQQQQHQQHQQPQQPTPQPSSTSLLHYRQHKRQPEPLQLQQNLQSSPQARSSPLPYPDFRVMVRPAAASASAVHVSGKADVLKVGNDEQVVECVVPEGTADVVSDQYRKYEAYVRERLWLGGDVLLAKDPRNWTKDQVSTWLKLVAAQNNLSEIHYDRFRMNGKALCLMTMDMFSARVPLGGKLLFKDFQLRLSKAMHGIT